MSSALSRLVRHRMAETGEKYTTALRAIQASPAEKKRLRLAEQAMRARMCYPCTPRDGLDARHVLSAWETQRRGH
jgi:hypothetical protein